MKGATSGGNITAINTEMVVEAKSEKKKEKKEERGGKDYRKW